MVYSQIVKKYSRYFLLILCLLFMVSLIRNIGRIRGASKKIDEKRQVVDQLENDNQELKKELEIVESNAFIEKQLRDKLGYAKEGEIVVVLPEEDILREIGKLKVDETEKLPDPNWVKWAKLFGIKI